MRHSIVITALFLLLGTTAGAQDYIRYRDGISERDGALQIAIESWTTPGGVTVDLYGVVHMADKDYYKRVQYDLDRYDSVLYEGIKKGDTPNKETQALGLVQGGMAKLMGLQFQKEGISYVSTNMVHADIDASSLERKLDGEKLSPFAGLISPEQIEQLKPFLGLLGKAFEAYSAANPDFQDGIKLKFAQQMASTDIEAQLSPKMRQAIIIDRNQIVMDVLNNRLRTTGDKKIAIFYGAGHNADFAKRFLALGYTRGSKRWLSAWTIGNGPLTGNQPAPRSRPVPKKQRQRSY